MTVPTSPTGWTLTKSFGVAVKDQDPQSGTDYATFVASATTTPWTVTITGLTSSALYRVGLFLEWTKPGSVLAYSVQALTSGTPS
jgi:hypothetical protein